MLVGHGTSLASALHWHLRTDPNQLGGHVYRWALRDDQGLVSGSGISSETPVSKSQPDSE